MRATACSLSRRSASVRGSNGGTGTGLPSGPTATKITRHSVRFPPSSPDTEPEETTVRMCMDEVPVCTIVASTSTRSPTLTGSAKWMFPT